MNKTDNIIWLKCTEYSEGNGVVKDKEGEVLNIMVGQVNLNWDWEMRRIQSCEDYPERGFGVFLVMRAVCAKTLGQDRIYYIWGTERKCVQIEPRSQEIQLERFWGSRSGKPWIYRKEFGVYMKSNGKLLRGFKLESDMTWYSFFKRSLLVVGWRMDCYSQSRRRETC